MKNNNNLLLFIEICYKSLRKNLHLISFLLSLVTLILLFKPLLSPLLDSGLNFCYGDFSLIIGTNSGFEKYQMIFYVFSQRYGATELHIIRRFLLEGSISALANLMPITDSQIASTIILISIVLGCYGMFKLISLFERDAGHRALLIPALTLFYFLNLWSVERIVHRWIWIAYAIFPLYLYFGIRYVLNKNLRYFVVYSLLLAIYGIIPHNLIYMLIIHLFLVISSTFLTDGSMKKARSILLFMVGPIAIYSFVNIPLLSLLLMTEGLKYPIPMSIDQLKMLSRNGNLLNIFTFSNKWWHHVPESLLENPLFRSSSLLLFAFTFSVALLTRGVERKRKALVILSMVLVVGLVFFIQGANNPILLNIIHFFGQLGYIDIFAPFREWGRLSILIPIFLVVMLTICLASLRGRKGSILALFFLALVSSNVVSSPSLVYINEVYSPTYVPLEYYNLSEKISLDHKVLWVYPSSAKKVLGTRRYTWNEQKAISQNLEQSIGSTHNPNLEYVKMLSRKEAPQQLLNALNIKYVIKRTDILGASHFRVNYSYLNCKKLDYLTVCENPCNLTPLYVPAILILSDMDGEDFYAITFLPIPHYVAVTTEPRSDVIKVAQAVLSDFNSIWLHKVAKKEGIILRPYKFTYFHNPRRFWSRTSTAEWHSYLERFEVENWQSDYREGLIFTWMRKENLKDMAPRASDLIVHWDFSSEEDFKEWKSVTPEKQFNIIQELRLDNDVLQAVLRNSTWGWKSVNSPLIPIDPNGAYRFVIKISGINAHKVHIKIAEFSSNKKLINSEHVKNVGDGTFYWKDVIFDYVPSSGKVCYVQLQIWHGHLTNKPLPNIIMIDYVKVYDIARFARSVTLDMSFNVPQSGEYRLFVRYFENQRGGAIRTYLDGKLIAEVSTVSQLNRFVWKDLGTFRLRAGRHVLRLENIEGFNAVNVFALIPVEEYNKLIEELGRILENKTVIYLFEAESDMFRERAGIVRDVNASNGEMLCLKSEGYAWQRFEVVKDGYYMIALRLNGSAKVKLDDRTFTISSDGLSFQYIGPIYLSKGLHVIRVEPIVRTVASWSFTNESFVAAWRRFTPEKQFNALHSVLWDSKEEALKVELCNSTWGWKVIKSPLIPARCCYNYVFMFKVKAVNGHAVHFKIIEYDEDGKLLNATYAGGIGDGTFGWKNITYTYTPKSPDVAYLQLQIWHGHLTNKPLPNTIWVKDVKVCEYKSVYLDVVWIYSVKSPSFRTTIRDLFKVKEEPAEVVHYERVDPTLWKAEVVARKPFMLVFAEAYDPLWEARVYKDGKPVEKVRSVPVYGVINGFWINETGDLTIVIRYVPQDWFELGLKISATTFALCVFYLVWDWRRDKGDRWALWIERHVKSMLRCLRFLGAKVFCKAA